QNQFVDTAAGVECLARNGTRTLVADVGHERGYDADAALQHRTDVVAVRGNGAHAPFAQHRAALREHVHGLEYIACDDGLEHVELQLPAFRSDRDRRVIADHLEASLVHDFRDHGIHLARHDARAWLHGRQVDLCEPGAWSTRKQAQVVAYLRQLDRDTLEDARNEHERTRVLRRLDEVRARDQLESRHLAQCATDGLGVARIGVDPGADRGCTHVDLAHEFRRFPQTLDIFADGHAVGAELLPERHRHGILQLRTTHLQHVVELARLLQERV